MKHTIIKIVSILCLFSSKESIAQTVITLTESFSASADISVDTDGILYIANIGDVIDVNNFNGTMLYKVTLDGEVTEFVSGLSGPTGNDFDSNGNLYQANFSANTISKITPDGTVSTFATTNIFAAVGVTVDNLDNVYSTRCPQEAGGIWKTSPAGVTTTFVTDILFQCPFGLAIDNEGNLYTADFNTGDIIKISPGGVVSVLATLPGGGAFMIFGNNRLYVAGYVASKIFEVSLTGEITVLAGTGGIGNLDGDPLESTWFHPMGIEISSSGNELFISSKDPFTGTELNPIFVRMIAGIGNIPPGYLVAGFTTDERSSVTSQNVQFTDISYSDPNSPITSWAWDFDDDGMVDSNEENPVWAYSDSGTYSVKLTVTNDSQTKTFIRKNYIGILVGVDEEGAVLPYTNTLSNAYPNPFNPNTIIEYSLSQSHEVSLIVYNLQGEEVTRLVNGEQNAGSHKVTWDASKMPSGIYFYRLQAGNFVQTRKMVLLK